jgi:hypothetical protein
MRKTTKIGVGNIVRSKPLSNFSYVLITFIEFHQSQHHIDCTTWWDWDIDSAEEHAIRQHLA